MKKENYWFIMVLFFLSSHLFACEFWLEKNNLGHSAGMTNDATEMFSNPRTWKRSRKILSVYMLRTGEIIHHRDVYSNMFLKRISKVLKKNNIYLALDVEGSTWMGFSKRREKIANNEIKLIRKMVKLGIKIDSINLQSVLSKKLKRGKHGPAVDYPLEKRINDVLLYVKKVKKLIPSIKIGIIDATVAHGGDYKRIYKMLNKVMKKNHYTLNHIILDIPFEIPHYQRHGVTWRTLFYAESFIRSMGLKVGIIYTSAEGGRKSNELFHDRILKMAKRYEKEGGRPDYCVLSAWFKYPDRMIPENKSYTMTYDLLDLNKTIKNK